MGIMSGGVLHLSAREAMVAMESGAVLLDIREECHTAMKTFKVERFILCPLSLLEENMDQLPRDRPMIVADATGLHSRVAVENLRKEGFTDIANLAGGIMDWERDGFPVEKDPAQQLSGQCPCMLKRPKNKA